MPYFLYSITKLVGTIIILIATGSPSLATVDEDLPKSLTRFLAPAGIEDISSIYTGDMAKSPLPKTLGQSLAENPGHDYTIRALTLPAEDRVFAITIQTPEGHVQDVYIHMAYDNGALKISALRALATTGPLFLIRGMLLDKESLNEEEARQLKNINLVLSTDAELKDHLRQNLTVLDALAKQAKIDGDGANKTARKMGLNFVKITETGLTNINVGGLIGNSVGYYYAPDKEHLPKMSADDHIYLDHIVGDWYIYKTT